MGEAGFDLSRLYTDFSFDKILYKKSADAGTYDIDRDCLIVDLENLKATLFGALLDFILYRKEMNNSFDFSKIDVRGFERVGHRHFSDDKIRVGKGLNEGYKDVILHRYFDIPYRYPEMANLARLIEISVGRSFMEKKYNNMELDSFKIRSFETEILDMDILYRNIYESGLLGAKMSSRRFSEVLCKLATKAMNKAQEISKEAIFRKRCRSEGTYMFNIYADERREARNMLRETRAIVLGYGGKKPFRVGLSEEDISFIEDGFAFILSRM